MKDINKEKNSIFEIILLLATEQFLVFPITFSVMVLAHYNWILLAYPLFFIFSCLVLPMYIFIPKKLHLPAVIGNLLIMASILSLAGGLKINTAIVVLVGAFFIFRVYWLLKHRNKGFSFYTFVAVGVISYVTCAFLYSHSTLFTPYGTYLAIASTFAVIGGCFCINLTHLSYERLVVNKISTVPKLTRSSNNFLLILFIILIIVIACFGFVDQIPVLLGYIWKIFKGIGSSISNWYNSLFKPDVPQPDLNNAAQIPDELVTSPPSLLEIILNQIGYYIGLTFISFGLAFMLYMTLKKSKYFFIFIKRKLIEYFKQFMIGQGGIEMIDAGYEDEITSLLEDGESTLDATRKWLASNRETDRPYFMLRNNAEKARWLYKRCVRKALNRGLELKGAMTSNEVLQRIHLAKGHKSDDSVIVAANTYDKARYGLKEPIDSDIKILKDFHR